MLTSPNLKTSMFLKSSWIMIQYSTSSHWKAEVGHVTIRHLMFDFKGDSCETAEVLPIELTIGSRSSLTAFLIINGNGSYNAILRRDWIYSNMCIPSSLHQILIFLFVDGNVEVVQADEKPFMLNSNAGDVWLYDRDIEIIQFTRKDDQGKSTEFQYIQQLVHQFSRPNVLSLGSSGQDSNGWD